MGRYERKKIRRDKRRRKEDEESERKRWIENNIELEEHRERERREDTLGNQYVDTKPLCRFNSE